MATPSKSTPRSSLDPSGSTDHSAATPTIAQDTRTIDGKPLYITVTILDPEVAEKDGEKFMVYPLSTEVCPLFHFLAPSITHSLLPHSVALMSEEVPKDLIDFQRALLSSVAALLTIILPSSPITRLLRSDRQWLCADIASSCGCGRSLSSILPTKFARSLTCPLRPFSSHSPTPSLTMSA